MYLSRQLDGGKPLCRIARKPVGTIPARLGQAFNRPRRAVHPLSIDQSRHLLASELRTACMAPSPCILPCGSISRETDHLAKMAIVPECDASLILGLQILSVSSSRSGFAFLSPNHRVRHSLTYRTTELLSKTQRVQHVSTFRNCPALRSIAFRESLCHNRSEQRTVSVCGCLGIQTDNCRRSKTQPKEVH